MKIADTSFKQKSQPLHWNFALSISGELLIVLSAIPPLFGDPEVLSSASDKVKLLAKNISKNTNLDDWYLFSSFPF